MVRRQSRGANPAPRGTGGFTLIEAAIATCILGIGVAALMVSVASGTRVNDASNKLTQATFLAQELREWTLKLSFDQVGALDDVDFSPPKDGQGVTIGDMAGWKQHIDVSWRRPTNLSEVVGTGASDVVYLEVTVSHYDQPHLTTGWLITRRN